MVDRRQVLVGATGAAGMLAAEAAYEAIVAGRQHDELSAYPAAFEQSSSRAWSRSSPANRPARSRRLASAPSSVR